MAKDKAKKTGGLEKATGTTFSGQFNSGKSYLGMDCQTHTSSQKKGATVKPIGRRGGAGRGR